VSMWSAGHVFKPLPISITRSLPQLSHWRLMFIIVLLLSYFLARSIIKLFSCYVIGYLVANECKL